MKAFLWISLMCGIAIGSVCMRSSLAVAQDSNDGDEPRKALIDANGNGIVDQADFFVNLAAPASCKSCPKAPKLRAPAEDAFIAQNNPAIGCPFHVTRGYGLQIVFDWTDVHGAGIVGYDVYAKKDTAISPIIDTFVPTSGYTFTQCNSFVADSNLTGWEWKVRTRDSSGNVSPWTTRRFGFAPCRLADGTPCYAPPGS
jgi:hypothetical protein